MKKKVLFLGASGLVGPFVTPGLESYCDLSLADVKAHPDGKAVSNVDITSFEQVREAARGMDAIMNFTVNRSHTDLSFHVNTRGAWNVMKAAAELGIKKVIHTAPQYIRGTYDHEFDIVDVPRATGTNHYCLTKMLGSEICGIYARTYEIQTICFIFNGLAARPTEETEGGNFQPFTVIWEDLQLACRLALDIDSVPDYYQEFNMLSYEGHGKYSVDKARRILGFEPTEKWESYFERTP